MEKFKVIYTVKRLDKGGLIADHTVAFNSFSEAVKFIRSLTNNSAQQIIGKPVLERN